MADGYEFKFKWGKVSKDYADTIVTKRTFYKPARVIPVKESIDGSVYIIDTKGSQFLFHGSGKSAAGIKQILKTGASLEEISDLTDLYHDRQLDDVLTLRWNLCLHGGRERDICTIFVYFEKVKGKWSLASYEAYFVDRVEGFPN